MKTKTLAAVVVCASLFSATSHAGIEEIFTRKSLVDHWLSLYVRVDLGKNFWRKGSSSTKRPKETGFIGGGIGYRFSDYPIRLEFSIYKNNFGASGTSNTWVSTRTLSYMANIYRDIVLSKDVTGSAPLRGIVPYITAGVGSAYHSNIKGIALNKSNQSMGYSFSRKRSTAWGAGIGAKLHLDKVWAVDIACKYVDLGKIPTTGSSVNMRGLQALASVVMHFW